VLHGQQLPAAGTARRGRRLVPHVHHGAHIIGPWKIAAVRLLQGCVLWCAFPLHLLVSARLGRASFCAGSKYDQAVFSGVERNSLETLDVQCEDLALALELQCKGHLCAAAADSHNSINPSLAVLSWFLPGEDMALGLQCKGHTPVLLVLPQPPMLSTKIASFRYRARTWRWRWSCSARGTPPAICTSAWRWGRCPPASVLSACRSPGACISTFAAMYMDLDSNPLYKCQRGNVKFARFRGAH